MFTIITPALRDQYRDLLSHIFNTRQGYYNRTLTQEMPLYDTPSTIYIAYVDPQNGVFGSCRLNSLTSSPAASFYLKRFQEGHLKDRQEVSLISFDMEEGHPSQEDEGTFDKAIQSFYHGLYEVLISLSLDQGYQGYVTLMDQDEHPDLTFFGEWTFDTTHTLTLETTTLAIGELSLGSYVETSFPETVVERIA